MLYLFFFGHWISSLFFQRFFIARTASMIASELPTHDVPTAPTPSPAPTGAWKSRPIMETHRFWMSADA